MLYFPNHFYSMYELCCMFMLSFSSPYVCAWIKHTVHMFWQTIWQLSASIHVTLLCYVHAWPRQSSVLGLCSHALPYAYILAYLMQLTFNLFSLCVYSSSCRPIGYSASRSDRNCRRCYYHCRYFCCHLGVGVHVHMQKLVHKMRLVQLVYIY